MSVCLWAGATIAVLAAPDFSLSWQHSVEKTEWREDWQAVPGGLRLDRAAVKGSGAGMEPADGARLEGGWWVWSPASPLVVPELVLAASGATGGAWVLCSGGECRELGAKPGQALRLAPCDQ